MFFAKTARFSVIEVGAPTLETLEQREQAVDANDVDALAAAVTKLQSAIKELKKSGISPDDKAFAAKNDELQNARSRLEKAQSEKKPTSSFNRKGILILSAPGITTRTKISVPRRLHYQEHNNKIVACFH